MQSCPIYCLYTAMSPSSCIYNADWLNKCIKISDGCYSPLPLSFNEAWQVVSMSGLKGVRYQICPGFLVHFIALLQSEEPEVLMVIFSACRLCQLPIFWVDSLGPNCSCTPAAHLSLPPGPSLKDFCEGWCANKNLFLHREENARN